MRFCGCSPQVWGIREPFAELVPIGPAKDTVPTMQRDIDRLIADGGTVVRHPSAGPAGHAWRFCPLIASTPSCCSATVGTNTPDDTDLDGLLRQLNGRAMDTTVQVFTIGYSDSADTEALLAIAEASRGKVLRDHGPGEHREGHDQRPVELLRPASTADLQRVRLR